MKELTQEEYAILIKRIHQLEDLIQQDVQVYEKALLEIITNELNFARLQGYGDFLTQIYNILYTNNISFTYSFSRYGDLKIKFYKPSEI